MEALQVTAGGVPTLMVGALALFTVLATWDVLSSGAPVWALTEPLGVLMLGIGLIWLPDLLPWAIGLFMLLFGFLRDREQDVPLGRSASAAKKYLQSTPLQAAPALVPFAWGGVGGRSRSAVVNRAISAPHTVLKTGSYVGMVVGGARLPAPRQPLNPLE